MPDRASVSVFILARDAGAATSRAIADAVGQVDDVTVIVSSREASASLEEANTGAAVLHRGFRNAAEAFQDLRAQNDACFWFWAEETPDEQAWRSVARFADDSRVAACAFAMGFVAGERVFLGGNAFRPEIRLWRGDTAPLMTDGSGLAVVKEGLLWQTEPGTIVHCGYGSATAMIDRIDFEVGCAVHAAVDLGLAAPERVGVTRLVGGWVAAWLRSGFRSPTARMVQGFHDRFWIPLYLNARLVEAATELSLQPREAWLTSHQRYSGAET